MENDEPATLDVKAWQRAMVRFRQESLGYGDLLTDIWLYEAFDIPYPGPQVSYAEAQKSVLAALTARSRFFEELLLRHQMAAISDGSGAYRIVQPKEQTKIAMDEGRRSFKRAANRMQDLVVNVNTQQLSAAERRENADALARASNLAGMLKQIWPSRHRDGEEQVG